MKVEEAVTNKIIEYLKQGKIPWEQPWVGMLPKNLVSKKEYSGINIFLLGMLEYKSSWFLTFKQAVNLKGKVKKGAKGHMVVYWDFIERITDKLDKHGKPKVESIPFIKYYTVFNLEQCEGIEAPEEFNHQTEPKYEEILTTYKNKPKLEEGNRACYNLVKDAVVLPPLNQFKRVEGYYATLYHEMTHSTGSEGRLGRFTANEGLRFGSEVYSKEELIAELGSAFLCARYHIDNRQLRNSVGYIQSWLSVLKNDPKMIIHASSKAQKAVNYMFDQTINLKD